MINNWDIISRQDPKSGGFRYTLVTDGTEHDARLIAKKLQGFVQEPAPAVAPYVYAFELPDAVNEETLDKIRTAATEAVEQSRKVNEFVPGGVLGDPLFNANEPSQEEKNASFGTIDPSASFFNQPAPQPPAAPAPSGAQEKQSSGEITINDKDMLIKDMEGTLLDKMPLEDIFSAETKYDMFLDLENQKLVKNAQVQREQKIGNLADGKDSLEETFNVFEQKIKDQTCIIDLEDLNTITDRLAKKDLSFIQHAHTNPPQAVPQELNPGETDAVVSPAGAALTDEAAPEEKTGAPVEGAVNLSVQLPDPQTPEEQEIIRAAMAQPPAEPTADPADEETFSFSRLDTPQPDNVDRSPVPTMFTVLEANSPKNADGKSATAQKSSEDKAPQEIPAEETSLDEKEHTMTHHTDEQTPASPVPDPLPDEVDLTKTISPRSAHTRAFSGGEPEDGLPEITIRGQKPDLLERTFNLETTMNTEIMRTQYEKSFHNPQDPPTMHHKLNIQAADIRPVPGQTNQTAVPPAQPQTPGTASRAAETPETTGENIMDENIEEKTTFRLRRKNITPAQPAAPAPQAPVPPAPAAPAVPPAQPIRKPAPVQPAAPQAQPATSPATPAPAQRTAAPAKPASPNPVIEKTKTIDHSIELPLSELKKHNWPLEVPMIPTYTLENMVISVNRFAHATAISVVENPGKLYNPLVFHGATGTGKTHFLHAMAYALSKKYGQENIFMTNGVRLSRGIQRYVMEGNIEKFEKFMDTVKVLLIDDIHLLAINEQNRSFISALLNKFLREQKQIVITSKYPPESLEKLEQLIRFKLDAGWISELKPTGGSTHLKIVKKMLLDNGVDLNDSQITAFFGGAHMTLGTITRSIRRLKVLENLIYPHMKEEDRSQASIFEKLLATTGEDESSQLLTKNPEDLSAITAPVNGDWGRIGFFYPQNSSNMMPWMVYALEQRAKELGIPGGFEIAVRSSYSTENIISSAFKIANLCDNKKLKGAVILGPALSVCDPSVRENFYDILTHMLEIMLIRCGIINAEDVKAPSTYVKVISELLR